MTKNNEQKIENLGSEKCVHRAHLGYKDAPYFKKCYSCRLQNNQLEGLQVNNTTEYCYKCNTENCLFKKLKAKEQECEELKYELVLKDVANIELSDEVKKYSKAIDEIEEIADNNYEIAEMEQIFLIIGGLDV